MMHSERALRSLAGRYAAWACAVSAALALATGAWAQTRLSAAMPEALLPADGRNWLRADADSLAGTRNRVFSIDVEGSVVWVGLGYTVREGAEDVPVAAGFLVSTDGGRTFAYRFPQIDAPGATTERYGANTLAALPIIVPQQSPPYDIDYDPRTGEVWVAGWASGLRRSRDGGRTWQRIVLPPDSLDRISPEGAYNFTLNPRGGTPGGHYNFTAFSVLVDETGTVWAGTPKGINRSTDGGQSWVRRAADGTPGGLTGSWVLSVEEQPLPGRNPVWMATLSAGRSETAQRSVNGVTVTRDGGETFEQVLLGERVIDFAFRGDTVYAAGRESGLFLSGDGGVTWTSVRRFRDRTRPDRLVRENADVYAVATTPGALWVGTSDGLLRSRDGGLTWDVYRTDVPLRPAAPSEDAPETPTYAYPNPFSPAADRFVRIRFAARRDDRPEVRIYDFANNLVRSLRPTVYADGETEAAWDGRSDDGLRAANGAYLYAVRTAAGTVWGKILVLE